MGVNKVEVDGKTIVDLTGDSVTPQTLAAGTTAHNAAGDPIVGALNVYTIDGSLSETSTNPVQNKVVTKAINAVSTVEVSKTQPTNPSTDLWINPESDEDDIYIPEIKDNEVSSQDTWSSEKISREIEAAGASFASSEIAYGTCDTAAATAEKAITIDDANWSLSVGTVIMVRFTTSNSASNVTLNVNGTGAYPIWYNNAEYTSTGSQYTGYAKRVINYMFDGTHWVWIGGGYDANSTYKNVTLGHGYATCSTAASTVAKVVTLASYTLTLGGIVAVKFTNAVPASATLNINSKGAKAMFFRGSAIKANVIKAGDTATFIYDGTQYQLLSIDRWQNDLESKANVTDVYSKTSADDKFQPKINYTTEIWVFTLEDGTTVNKTVMLRPVGDPE